MSGKTTAIKDELAQLLRSQGDIERQIGLRRISLLKALPESMGYESVEALIRALTPLVSEVGHRQTAPPVDPAAPRRKRQKKYDGQVRARVRYCIETLRHRVAATSRAEGVSIPTIMKWKREWGLTSSPRGRVRSPKQGVPETVSDEAVLEK